jgi:TRAP-type C4-dicarboxylate transport system permease large subunit
MTNHVLVAIPLFVFMGIVLERSRIAEDLLETMGRLFGNLRGGLASRSSSSARCWPPPPASSAPPSSPWG